MALDLLARAEAWGLTSVWLGAGPRPRPDGAPAARHVVWLEDADPARAARSGDLVLLYHLLWELTHVVFEHPGLLCPTVPARSLRSRGDVASRARTRAGSPRCAPSWRTGGSRCSPAGRWR